MIRGINQDHPGVWGDECQDYHNPGYVAEIVAEIKGYRITDAVQAVCSRDILVAKGEPEDSKWYCGILGLRKIFAASS